MNLYKLPKGEAVYRLDMLHSDYSSICLELSEFMSIEVYKNKISFIKTSTKEVTSFNLDDKKSFWIWNGEVYDSKDDIDRIERHQRNMVISMFLIMVIGFVTLGAFLWK